MVLVLILIGSLALILVIGILILIAVRPLIIISIRASLIRLALLITLIGISLVPVSYTHLDVYKRQAVLWQNQLAMSFHPELSGDPSVHAYFLNMVQNAASLSEGRPA